VSAPARTVLRVQRPVVAFGLAGLAVVAVQASTHGWRLPVLLGLGGLLGVALYHAAFGFTAAYRRMFLDGDTAAVRAQIVMLGVATLLFAPTLAGGSGIGIEVSGAAAPLGLQVLVGAFLFGLGMQLGNGCGSGTLFTLGGGSTRMIATLAFFCAGSFWASLDMQWWNETPRRAAIVLGEEIGWPGAAAAQLAFLGLLWWALRRFGKDEAPGQRGDFEWRRLATGGWPFLWGALALAVLSWFSLMVAGHPWSITWAFSLWGAKAAQLFGWNPEGVWFWTGGYQEYALGHSIFEDTVSVMNFGIVFSLDGGGPRGPIYAGGALAVALARGGCHRRIADGVRSADRLRLQYRRVFLRCCLDQPAWLALDCGGARRHMDRHPLTALVRAC